MYRNILISTILLFISGVTYGQTYSSITSDTEIYNFLNWLVKTHKKHQKEPLTEKLVNRNIILWEEDNFNILDTSEKKYPELNLKYLFKKKEGTDTIFIQTDREFLYHQFTLTKDTIWHKQFESSKLINNYTTINQYSFSIPLFSLNKEFVIIRQKYYCGNECAHGGYYVYKRNKLKKWKYVTTVNSWTS